MADDLSTTTTTTSRRPTKKHVAIGLAALLVVAGGITITSVTAANAAEETARQCELAVTGSKAAVKTATTSVEQADAALEAVKSIALPGDEGWTSADYAARAGAEAVDAVPARLSGADLISTVTDGRTGLAKVKAVSTCEERDQATEIQAATKKVTADAKTLDTNVTALTDDFTVFQGEERTRVAAEVEAARIAAEAEAARLAAEAEAARVAAEAEAARVAANQRASSTPRSPGGSSYSGGGGAPATRSAPAPSAPAPAPAPYRGSSGTPGGGGGYVGPPGGQGNNGGVCWTSNGTGGLRPC